MRQLPIVAALICVVAGGAVAAPTPRSDAGRLRSDIENEEVIRKLYEQFIAAWNRHDIPAMASMWVEDGDHVEPDGHIAKGRHEIQKLFKMQHDSVFKKTRLSLTIDTVWFVTANVALVDGNYEVAGVVAPDGKEIPPRKGRLTAVFLHERGRWWIVADRLMIPAPLPYKK
jgi:uncharacterized protein (TIGR02246 family)